MGNFYRIDQLCAHHGCLAAPPFQYERSTGNNIFSLARLFDSLVRVSRRVEAPHFLRQHGAITQKQTWLAASSANAALSAPISPVPSLMQYSFCNSDYKPRVENAVRLVLAGIEMEVLPLSLSRLQVLCHSLSKVLFKLSLTLLVRYRSSYSVFNFGRHIPAA